MTAGTTAPAWMLGAVLVLTANDACATAVSSLATSVGVLAALAAFFVVKGWPAQLPLPGLPAAGGALLVAAGAVWWWRTRTEGPWRGAVVPKTRRVHVPESLASKQRVELPTGFDRELLLEAFRQHFLQIQEAWDQGAMPLLQTLTTEDMLLELRLGLPARVEGGAAGRTEVITLRADLFGFEELAGAYLATVEFSGLMRESAGEGAAPFRELWMLTQSKDGKSGWRLARHQALL